LASLILDGCYGDSIATPATASCGHSTTTVDPAGRDQLGVPHCRMANRFPGLI
jgi:hypothetical protein